MFTDKGFLVMVMTILMMMVMVVDVYDDYGDGGDDDGDDDSDDAIHTPSLRTYNRGLLYLYAISPWTLGLAIHTSSLKGKSMR